ncbi:MAG: hypothetical protein C3F11_05030 [Methylocystaceae bacterium]|nr:MAG: hypothetical protein C3F11_05030 [Methylocystaceae bacterium]
MTEVKTGAFNALDCGANLESWQETFIQLWDILEGNRGHMPAGKFRMIPNDRKPDGRAGACRLGSRERSHAHRRVSRPPASIPAHTACHRRGRKGLGAPPLSAPQGHSGASRQTSNSVIVGGTKCVAWQGAHHRR